MKRSLKEISYATKEVSVDVDIDAIINAPEIDTSKPIEAAFVKALLDYYERVFHQIRNRTPLIAPGGGLIVLNKTRRILA